MPIPTNEKLVLLREAPVQDLLNELARRALAIAPSYRQTTLAMIHVGIDSAVEKGARHG